MAHPFVGSVDFPIGGLKITASISLFGLHCGFSGLDNGKAGYVVFKMERNFLVHNAFDVVLFVSPTEFPATHTWKQGLYSIVNVLPLIQRACSAILSFEEDICAACTAMRCRS